MIKKKHEIAQDLHTLKDYSWAFLRHPIDKIREVPLVSWESCVVVVFAINLVCGVLRAFYQFSLINFMISFLITPFVAAAVLMLLSLFVYYFFQILFKQTYSYEKICTILFLSYIPAAPLYIGSVVFPPLFIFALVINAILVVIGLSDNLQLPQKPLIRLVSGFAIFVLIFWLVQQIFLQPSEYTPKTLDQLEEEILSM